MQVKQQIVMLGLSQTCRLVCGGAMSMPVVYASMFHTAHDYYPFGQYIPGRYTDDTATHCLTTTYSGMAMVLLYDSVDISRSSTFGSATFFHMTSPMIPPVTSPLVSWGPGYIITSTAGSGAEIIMGPVSVHGDKVMLKFNRVINPHDFTVYDDMTGTPLTATTSTTGFAVATTVTLNIFPAAIPHSSYLRIRLECTASGGGALSSSGIVELISVTVPLDTVVPSNIVSTVCNNDGYRYGYNGKMKDNEWAGVGNHYDYGARHYDPRVARFISIDPHATNYPSISPYVYVADNPLNAIDPDGKDVFLITYATKYKNYGHSAIAVENYVTEFRVKSIDNGKVSGEFVRFKDGTVTIYELGAEGEFEKEGRMTALESVTGKYIEKKGYTNALTTGALSDYSGGEAPDGVIQFKTNSETDNATHASLAKYRKQNPNYQGTENNCTDYAAKGVEVASGTPVTKSRESNWWGLSGTTPGALFNEAKTKPNAKVIKDPGKKTQKSFEDVYEGK